MIDVDADAGYEDEDGDGDEEDGTYPCLSMLNFARRGEPFIPSYPSLCQLNQRLLPAQDHRVAWHRSMLSKPQNITQNPETTCIYPFTFISTSTSLKLNLNATIRPSYQIIII